MKNEHKVQSNRRHFLKGSIAAGGAILAGDRIAIAAEEPLADTAAGKIRGYSDGPIKVFKGVPYAASTEGSNRWLPAKPLKAWSGVRDTTKQGPMCPQRTGAPMKEETEMMQDGPYTEDCLNLNISTPAIGKNSGKRAVMVWFHGGGYAAGSGGATSYDGRNLCEKHDVVLVTVTHRLNIFGFLYLADLFGDAYADSGNVGILDCVAALQWVRANIANFGGDPSNVTIFGQSGGAGKVSTLMGMPPAKGLFHRAIAESGAAVRSGVKEQAAAAATRVMDALGVKTLSELQAMSADKLVQVMAPARFNASPVVDGRSLPANVFDPTASRLCSSIPFMTGTTRNESNFFSPDPPLDPIDDARLNELLKGNFRGISPEDLERLVKTVRVQNPGQPNQIIYQLIASQSAMTGIQDQADRKAEQHGAPVFVYYFAHTVPARGGKLGAPHTAEIPYAFDSLAHSTALIGTVTPREQAVADKVSLAWTNFAKTGNPSNKLMPDWKPYTSKQRAIMVIDDQPKLVQDPLRDSRVIISELRGRYQLVR